jgi:uncharacterized membrane protein YciS (DUF1049 family)
MVNSIRIILCMTLMVTLIYGKDKTEIRFAQFTGRSEESGSVYLVQTDKSNSIELKPLTIYEQIYDGYSPKIKVEFQGRPYEFTANSSIESNKLTICFWWDGSFRITPYVDIGNFPQAFRNISRRYTSRRPYHNNTFLRVIQINPSRRNISLVFRQTESTADDYRELTAMPLHESYLVDTGYCSKQVKIIDRGSDQSGSGDIIYTHDYNLDSHTVNTLFLYMDNDQVRGPYFYLHVDYSDKGTLLSLVFMAVYILAWAVFRTLYSKMKIQKSKSKFYVAKTIRVQTSAEKDTAILAEDVEYIDTIRGLAIIGLIFVKSGGGNYVFFSESLWNGLTLGDLPKFTISWLMGFCIPLGIYKNRFRPVWKYIRPYLTKGSLVFFLGNIYIIRYHLQSKSLL